MSSVAASDFENGGRLESCENSGEPVVKISDFKKKEYFWKDKANFGGHAFQCFFLTPLLCIFVCMVIRICKISVVTDVSWKCDSVEVR